MNGKDERRLSPEHVNFGAAALPGQRIPTVRVNAAEIRSMSVEYGSRLVEECRKSLTISAWLTGQKVTTLYHTDLPDAA